MSGTKRKPLYCWDSCIFLAWFNQEKDKPLDEIKGYLEALAAGNIDLIVSAVSASRTNNPNRRTTMTTVITLRDLQGFDLFDSQGNEIQLDTLLYGDYVLDECEKTAYDPDWSTDCRVFAVTPLDDKGYRQPLQQFTIYARQ